MPNSFSINRSSLFSTYAYNSPYSSSTLAFSCCAAELSYTSSSDSNRLTFSSSSCFKTVYDSVCVLSCVFNYYSWLRRLSFACISASSCSILLPSLIDSAFWSVNCDSRTFRAVEFFILSLYSVKLLISSMAFSSCFSLSPKFRSKILIWSYAHIVASFTA